MKRVDGFSLLETLAALALLALLLLGVTAGLQAMTQSTRAGMAMGERLDEMRAAQDYLRRAISGAMAYPFALQGARNGVVFRGDASHATFVAPGPGYLHDQGLQLQHLVLEGDDSDRRLVVAFDALPTRAGAKIVPGQPEVLIDHVVSGRFRYSGLDDQGLPVTWRPDWPYVKRLPTMVGIELELQGGVRWPMLTIPLRMDPRATNAREGIARLLAQGVR